MFTNPGPGLHLPPLGVVGVRGAGRGRGRQQMWGGGRRENRNKSEMDTRAIQRNVALFAKTRAHRGTSLYTQVTHIYIYTACMYRSSTHAHRHATHARTHHEVCRRRKIDQIRTRTDAEGRGALLPSSPVVWRATVCTLLWLPPPSVGAREFGSVPTTGVCPPSKPWPEPQSCGGGRTGEVHCQKPWKRQAPGQVL